MDALTPPPPDLRRHKRGDLVVEEIKRWILDNDLRPGSKLPKEKQLRELFSVSKGTIREALKSLEVQGLVTISTGPAGGATLVEVPLNRSLQFLHNYFYFKEISPKDIYTARRILEPEMAASAVEHLTEQHFEAMERSVEACSERPHNQDERLRQRREDLHFHDIIADANPNPFIRFVCQLTNNMLSELVVFGNEVRRDNWEFGKSNLEAHKALLAAFKKRSANRVRRLMREHMETIERHVTKLNPELHKRLILDADLRGPFDSRRQRIRNR